MGWVVPTIRAVRRQWLMWSLLLTVFYLLAVLDEMTQGDDPAGTAHATTPCKRPQLDYLSLPDAFTTLYKYEAIQCATQPNWVTCENGQVMRNPEARVFHSDQLSCQIALIHRVDDFTFEMKPGAVTTSLEEPFPVPTDFVEVTCQNSRGDNYSMVHSTISRKRKVQASLGDTNLAVNVLIWGFDSMSRLSWLRALPLTYAYFTKQLAGVTMEGYNIVGDGTPQNLLPMLTGHSETEIPETRRGFPGAIQMDSLTWIWKEYRDAGYVTQWGEDGANYGTFQYRYLGFRDPPVDHYMRPFYLATEESYKQYPPFCLGSQPRHISMINWLIDFFNIYQNQPKLSFLFHSELSHDLENYLPAIDKDFVSMLTKLHKRGHLNNTILILMSDHGARFAKIRSTLQGKYEERLPFLGISLPPHIVHQYPWLHSNLISNAQKLITPFDVYETLKSILHFDKTTLEDKNHYEGPGLPRAISLFRPIPAERSCSEAGISNHWCTCLRWKDVNPADENVQAAAWTLVRRINEMTSGMRFMCAELTSVGVAQVQELEPDSNLLRFRRSRDREGRIPDFTDITQPDHKLYQVQVMTSPNNGLYEGTVKHVLSNNQFIIHTNEISRVNPYGDEPHCIRQEKPHLRPFCYCLV